MKLLLSLLSLVLVFVLATPAFAALSNENNPHVICVALGSPSADAVTLAGVSNKAITIKGVNLLNAATIAASDTDYVKIELKKGSTIVAELDSRAAHENALTANTKEPLNLVSSSVSEVAASSVLSVNYDETDSGTAVALTGAILCIDYVSK